MNELESGYDEHGRRERWTVMVFMGVGEVPGDESLRPYADEDLAEMRDAENDQSGGLVNIFAQMHSEQGATREWIGKGSEQVAVGSATAQDGGALTDFIEWSLAQANHQPGDRTLLVLWGHAYQFAIGRERTPTGLDALDFGELAQVFRSFQDKMRRNYPKANYGEDEPRLDIIGFDACDVSTIEVAHMLSPFADYLISSQIGIPLPGWPYREILGRLKEPRTRKPMTPADFGAFAVRRFCETYDHPDGGSLPRPVSLTLLDLAMAGEAFDAAEDLAQSLAFACGSDEEELGVVQHQFFASQTIDDKPFIDVADFCVNLSRHSSSQQVRETAAALGDILVRPRPSGRPRNGARGSFVIEHGRNSHETAKLQGVSLYAPQLTAATDDWRGMRYWYNKFAFQNETVWSRLIHVLAEGT